MATRIPLDLTSMLSQFNMSDYDFPNLTDGKMGVPSGTDESSHQTEAFDGMEALNIFRIILSSIGIFGNLFVILVILILGEVKKGITVWYILQLAISDTIFLLTIPFQVVEDQNGRWMFPDWMCRAQRSILYINYYSSMSFLTVMAVDRYIAVCHSFSERLQKLRTRKAAYFTTAIVWIVCILISIPVMKYSVVAGVDPSCTCKLEFPQEPKTPEEKCTEAGILEESSADFSGDYFDMCLKIATLQLQQEQQQKHCKNSSLFGPMDAMSMSSDSPAISTDKMLNMRCHYQDEANAFKIFVLFNFSVMFLLPLTIIVVCYALIITHLVKKSFRGDGSRTTDNRNRNKVIYMCLALVFVFIACWLPFHAQHIAKFAGMPGRTTAFCDKLIHATSFIAHANSAINPFIYFIIARCKSHVERVTRSRAASAVITMFTKHGNGDHTNASKLDKAGEETKLSDRTVDVSRTVV